MHAPWLPLLPDDRAALAAAAAIGNDLLAAGPLPPSHPLFYSLGRGEAGIALFLAYLDRALPGRGYGDAAFERLGLAVAAVSEQTVRPGLYGGFAGVAWVVEHLQRHFLGLDPDDPAAEIAGALAELLARPPWNGPYDLLSGLVGFGVHALERLPRPGSREILAHVLARLGEQAGQQAEGVAFLNRPEWFSDKARERLPEGYYDLGMAHGLPAVIALLAAARARGATREEDDALLDRAVAGLFAHRLEAGGPIRYPYDAGGTAHHRARLSWCHGDLGIAAALLPAARAAGRSDWEAEALATARTAAARGDKDADVVDACLCHGATGNGHLFHRLHRATGDPHFANVARAWYERALAERSAGQGVGGFTVWTLDEQGKPGWVAEPGFLNGAAGIGLALLAAATDIEPAWDRLLLIS